MLVIKLPVDASMVVPFFPNVGPFCHHHHATLSGTTKECWRIMWNHQLLSFGVERPSLSIVRHLSRVYKDRIAAKNGTAPAGQGLTNADLTAFESIPLR
jgi:hypothetical protein